MKRRNLLAAASAALPLGAQRPAGAQTWPDRPVLFDELEKLFIKEGYDSPLMYCHKSPGLLRLKSKSK